MQTKFVILNRLVGKNTSLGVGYKRTERCACNKSVCLKPSPRMKGVGMVCKERHTLVRVYLHRRSAIDTYCID